MKLVILLLIEVAYVAALAHVGGRQAVAIYFVFCTALIITRVLINVHEKGLRQ